VGREGGVKNHAITHSNGGREKVEKSKGFGTYGDRE